MSFYLNGNKIGKNIEFDFEAVTDISEALLKDRSFTFETDDESIPTKIFNDIKMREQEMLDKIKKELEEGKRVFHTFFIYECDTCGATYIMWLEKGLEDYRDENSKPVPFFIKCPMCVEGNAKHVHYDVTKAVSMKSTSGYHPYRPGMNIFVNLEEKDCGHPLICQVDMYRMDLDRILNSIFEMYLNHDMEKETRYINNDIDMLSNFYEMNNRATRRHLGKSNDTGYKRPRKGEKKFF